MKRIHLCGTHGSGKSTFGKILSEKTKIPLHSLVDIKYKRKYDQIRPVKERLKLIKKLANKKTWITEECWSDYAEELFKKSDKVILILTPKKVCQYRVLKRFLLRKKEKKDNLKATLNMMKRVGNYYSNKDNVCLQAHLDLCKKYKKVPIILKNKKQITKFLNALE